MWNPTRTLSSICITTLLLPAATLALDFGGPINEDTNWSASDSPVTLTDDVRISEGATLTITVGAEVRLNGHVISTHWPGFPVGYLQANGAVFSGSAGLTENIFHKPDDTIEYCSFIGVRVLLNASGGTLRNCSFSTSYYGIMVQGEWTIRNCEFENCAVGIWQQLNYRVSVRNCNFVGGDEGFHFLALQGYPPIDIRYCNFLGVASGVTVDGSPEFEFIDASQNFWGDASGPTHPDNPGGIGAPVDAGVAYVPWLTESASPTSAVPNGLAAGGATLRQNNPNPFNPLTAIAFELAQANFVKLAVYSLSGRRVATLVEGPCGKGPHTAVWDGCDATGQDVASGTYCYRLDVGGVSTTKTMVLVR